jgi:hypothetical protein
LHPEPPVNSTYIQNNKPRYPNKRLFDSEGNSYYLETEERGLVPGEIIKNHLIKNGSQAPYSPFKVEPNVAHPPSARKPPPTPKIGKPSDETPTT